MTRLLKHKATFLSVQSASESLLLGNELGTPCRRLGGLRPAHTWPGVLILEQLQSVCTVDGQGVTHLPEALLGMQGECRAFSNR